MRKAKLSIDLPRPRREYSPSWRQTLVLEYGWDNDEPAPTLLDELAYRLWRESLLQD